MAVFSGERGCGFDGDNSRRSIAAERHPSIAESSVSFSRPSGGCNRSSGVAALNETLVDLTGKRDDMRILGPFAPVVDVVGANTLRGRGRPTRLLRSFLSLSAGGAWTGFVSDAAWCRLSAGGFVGVNGAIRTNDLLSPSESTSVANIRRGTGFEVVEASLTVLI